MAEPTKTREGDQPLPTPGRECVQDALIALIEERKQLGIQRYGSPLMTHNGRSAIRDALEESLDLTVYLMQVEMEAADQMAELEHLRGVLADVLGRFVHKGHPGEECLQTGWIRVATVQGWRDALKPPPCAPVSCDDCPTCRREPEPEAAP